MRALHLKAVTIAAAGLLLTGCGLLGEDDGTDAAPEAGSDTGEEQTPDEAMLDFAACMRDAGFDMPDPDPDNEGVVVALPDMDPDDEDMMAAMQACEELLPVDENGPSEEEMFEKDLELAECLRENGFDVEDPEPGQGLALPVAPEDDEDMAALTTCTESEGEAEGDS